MKKAYLLIILFLGSLAASAQSPRKQAEGEIDGIEITVDYGSPSVKGRKIWGGLEPYGKVWRAGANEATTVEFSDDVMINGNALEAGKYSFFILPQEKGEWTVIFNTNPTQWGAFKYDEKLDALRVDVEPEWDDSVQEALMYSVDEGLSFAWEKARITLEVESVNQ